MKNEKIEILLEKLRNGSLTLEEETALIEFIDNPDEVVYETLQTMWDNHSENYIKEDLKNEILKEIEKSIKGNEQKMSRKIKLKRTLSIAASIICILCLNYFLITNLEKESTVNSLIVQTKKGEQTSVYLPDSSVITINGETRLEYPQNFSDNKREIYFDGEAYFKIAKNENSTFTINIDDYKVEVLGTEFNINTLWNNNIELSLVSGEVKITLDANDSEPIHLVAGQKAIYNKDSKQVRIEKSNNRETAWLTKEFVFDSVPISQIFNELGRAYGVVIQIQGDFPLNLKDDKFTAVMKGNSLSEILNLLTKYYNFTYKISNDKIYINFN